DLADGLDSSGYLGLIERAWFLEQGVQFLGEFFVRLGRSAEALRAFHRACDRWEAIRKDWRGGHEAHDFWCEYAYCLASLGRLYAAAGRRAEAARALDRVRNIIERADVEATVMPGLPRCLALALGQTAALIGLGRTELTSAEQAERQALAD